jgi:HEAT repeat protein
MSALEFCRFWQSKRLFGAGILAFLCVVGPASAGYGRTDKLDKLIGQLKSEDDATRERAAGTLAYTRDPRAVGPLIAALKDTDGSVRESASEGLVRIGRPAVEPLIVALKDNDAEAGS